MTSSPSSWTERERELLSEYTNHDCRTEECRAVWRKYMAEYRQRNRERINAQRRKRRAEKRR